MPQPPLPSKTSTLERIKAFVPTTSVVDVGVREQTKELVSVFPHLKHHLFEPAKEFFGDIEKFYKGIDHTLYPLALSDADSTIYLVIRSLEKNGVATHSGISDTAPPVDGLEVLAVTPIDVKRFDSIGMDIEKNFLLKVDVDGKDLHVLRGFGSMLKLASSVIVECTCYSMIERMSFVQAAGFGIVDMVDFVYYGPSLYQFDAVFVRNDLLSLDVRPNIREFDPALWRSVGF